MTAKYKMDDVRSLLLKFIASAYPGKFKGVAPSEPPGERAFSGPTPHPNEVLNLFVQQGLTSALPIAYYMAARKGVDSLLGSDPPQNPPLRPEILRSAMRGLVMLREFERDETRLLIFRAKDSHLCSTSHSPTYSIALEACRKVFDRTVSSPSLGTKVLQVPEFHPGPSICSTCVGKWESGHAEMRKKAWEMLPYVFGLKD